VITPAATPVTEGAGQARGSHPALLEARRPSLPLSDLSHHPLASAQNAQSGGAVEAAR